MRLHALKPGCTEQIIVIQKDGESGMPVNNLCRKYGIIDVTIYNWKSEYGSMMIGEAQCLQYLEHKNRLQEVPAVDQLLDIRMFKKIAAKKAVTPETWHRAVMHLHKSFGHSPQMHCSMPKLTRSGRHYSSKADVNDQIRKRLRKLNDERKQRGNRRLH